MLSFTDPRRAEAMKTFLCGLLVISTLFVTGLTDARAADDPLEPMKMRVGTWISKTTHKKAAWTPETKTFSGIETAKWALDKTFLQGAGEVKVDGVKSHWMWRYDENAKVHRFWYFDNKYAFPLGDSIGHWNAKSKIMTWKMDIGNGNRGSAIWKTIDKDHYSWSMKIYTAEGKLAMDVFGTATRKK